MQAFCTVVGVANFILERPVRSSGDKPRLSHSETSTPSSSSASSSAAKERLAFRLGSLAVVFCFFFFFSDSLVLLSLLSFFSEPSGPLLLDSWESFVLFCFALSFLFLGFLSFDSCVSATGAGGFSDSPSLKPDHSSPSSSEEGGFKIEFFGFPDLAYPQNEIMDINKLH